MRNAGRILGAAVVMVAVFAACVPARAQEEAPENAPTPIELPFGLEAAGGGEPTVAQAEEGPVPVLEGPGWLDRALGLGDSRIETFGWIQNTFTGNTDGTPASGRNFALFPNHLANQWMGNQYYLVATRAAQQSDGLDWGFRIDALFGNDWSYTKMLGVFDRAFVSDRFAGFDLPQIYGEAHLPLLTEGGLDVKFGRWYSVAGYESVMATHRPLLSWPYIMTYFPFTFSGLMTTFHATDRLNVFNGAVPGVDRWFNEHYRWTYIGGLGWTSQDGRTTATFVVMNGPNQLPSFFPTKTPLAVVGFPSAPYRAGRPNPGYARNDRFYTQNVVTHNWSDRLVQAAEFSGAFDQNTPGAGPGGRSQDTRWFGAANWFLYDLTENLTGIWRTEVFHDGSPYVTGVSDTYYAFTLGALYKPRDWLWIRPEARYDWAQYHHPFNDGTRSSRFTIGIDVIVRF